MGRNNLMSGSSACHPQHCWGLHKVAKVPHERDVGECNTVLFDRTIRSMNVTKRMEL